MNTDHKTKSAVGTEVRERLNRFTDEARTRIKKSGEELLEDAQSQGERALKSSRTWISKNPGAAVGYAFLAGVIAYGWFGRKSKD